MNCFAKQAKLFKKTSFSKATVVTRFPAKKNAGCTKLTARFLDRQEKMALSTPHWVVLGLPSPSPRVCTGGGQTYADITTKISRIDRLPNLLRIGAPLAR